MRLTAPGVYMILNTLTDARYVGSAAISLSRRWGEHRCGLKNGKHRNAYLQNAWNKYGADAFQFVPLENTEPADAVAREQYWIDTFKAQGIKLYNIAPKAGSQLGYKHRPETIARFSATNRGKKRLPHVGAAIRERQLGKPKSEKDRLAMSRGKVAQWPDAISPDGVVFKVGNMSAFCREHGLGISVMSKVLRGELPSHLGWRLYDGGEPAPFTGKVREWYIPYIVTAPDGRAFETSNLEAFAREHGLDAKSLRRVAHGSLLTTGGGWTAHRPGEQPRTESRRIPPKERRLISPDGVVHVVLGLASFCRLHGLDKGAIQRVLRGTAKSHKGWTAYSAE